MYNSHALLYASHVFVCGCGARGGGGLVGGRSTQPVEIRLLRACSTGSAKLSKRLWMVLGVISEEAMEEIKPEIAKKAQGTAAELVQL